MGIQLYNSLTRSKDSFSPLEEGKVGIYCCGPTVYDYVHIGNLRAAAFFDLLRRFLLFKGFNVTQVINVTDVDDKIIKAINQSGKSLQEHTDFFKDAYVEDLRTLNFQIPEVMPRATEEIDGMVAMIEALLEKGHAYKTESGDIYFKISSFEDYGKLAGLDLSQIQTNASGRLDSSDNYDKDNAQDFALWKSYDEADGEVFWETSIGKGRPGWHIECSAMSTKYLGQPFDIHCGGIDLIFPHHTNEIAQAECACDKEFARTWMHNGFLQVDGQKMSKSLGNFFTLRDLLGKGMKPAAIRFELLRVHYRAPLDFRASNMTEAISVVDKFYEFISPLRESVAFTGDGWSDVASHCAECLTRFEEALDDDLNISNGLTAVFHFMTQVNKHRELCSKEDGEQILETFRKIDQVLGLEDLLFSGSESKIPEEVENLIAERQEARAAKDFAKADEVRDRLLEMGFEIKDTPQGVKWKRL